MRIVQFVFAKSDLVSHTSRLKDLIPLVACLMIFLVDKHGKTKTSSAHIVRHVAEGRVF